MDEPGPFSELGERLATLRAERGLSYRQAAALSGLSASFIRMVEIGESGIGIERLARLAAAYGAELSEVTADANTVAALDPEEGGDEHQVEQHVPVLGPHYVAAAAIDLILERRPDESALLTELTARIRARPRDVEQYFSDDAALLAHAYELAMRMGADHLMSSWDESASTWEQLEKLVEQQLPGGGAFDAAILVWLRIVQCARHAPALAASQEEIYGYAVGHFAAIIRAGQAAGEMQNAVDPEQAGWQLQCLTDGVSLQLVADSSAIDLPRAKGLVLAAAHRLLDRDR